MEDKKYQLINAYDEEKNLIEVIKILLKNKKTIAFIAIVVFIIGISVYSIYTRIKPLHMEQKFYLSYIDKMEEMTIAGVPVGPEMAFKDDKFIDMFFQKEFIKNSFKGTSDKEKRGYIQSKLVVKMEKIKTDRFLYTLTSKGKTIDENRLWATTYFELLNLYIEKQNRDKLDKDYIKLQKKSEEYRGKLQEIEEEIKKLVNLEKQGNLAGIVSLADEIREKNPRVFSEKDVYSELYTDVFKQKEDLKQFIDFLDNNIEYRSSLVESDGKINLMIAGIVSLTFGLLLGVLLVLLRNYIKSVKWD